MSHRYGYKIGRSGDREIRRFLIDYIHLISFFRETIFHRERDVDLRHLAVHHQAG